MTVKCSVPSCAVGWAPSVYSQNYIGIQFSEKAYSPVHWQVWRLRLRGHSQLILSAFPVAVAAQASDNLAVVLLQHYNFDFFTL